MKWTDEELKVLKDRYLEAAWDELLELFPGRTKEAIKLKVSRICPNKPPRSSSRLTYNKELFNTITPISCYYAGYTAADGHISVPGNNVQYDVATSDRVILEDFKQNVDYTGTIKDRIVSCGNGTPCYASRLRFFAADKWRKGLEDNFNVTSNKSTLLLPPVTSSVYLDFCYIVGFIDGDGSLYHKYPAIKIVGGLEILMWIRNIFDINFPGNKIKIFKPADSNNILTYQVSGKRALKIIHHFKSLPIPKLDRKWNKF